MGKYYSSMIQRKKGKISIFDYNEIIFDYNEKLLVMLVMLYQSYLITFLGCIFPRICYPGQ